MKLALSALRVKMEESKLAYDRHSQIDYALCDLGTVCDATSEALMAHLHDGADMTSALDVLGTQLPRGRGARHTTRFSNKTGRGDPEGTAPAAVLRAYRLPAITSISELLSVL